MISLKGVVTGFALLTAALLAGAKANAAEVSKYQFVGPSASARFHRVTPTLCSSGALSYKDETIYVAGAKFRERIDGVASPDFPSYVTIFSFNGCNGVYSFGSADLTSVDFSQAEVQRASLSGRADVPDFTTGASLGTVIVDMLLNGDGPTLKDGGHTNTDYGSYRVIEVWQGKARSATFSGSVTLAGAELGPYFEAPINALTSGHYVSTTITP